MRFVATRLPAGRRATALRILVERSVGSKETLVIHLRPLRSARISAYEP